MKGALVALLILSACATPDTDVRQQCGDEGGTITRNIENNQSYCTFNKEQP